jgi:hypothetical protein
VASATSTGSVLIRLAQVLKVTVEDLIGQPLSLAASAYHLGHVFLRAGQVEEATGVAMTAARALEPWRPPIRSTCRHGARCI